MIEVTLISADKASELCRQITADLPECFGLTDVNEHYRQGVKSRVNFAASVDNVTVGLLCLEFLYPESGNIYWMGILKAYQSKGIGQALLNAAHHYAKDKKATTLTVETLAPTETDENHLKTYRFYQKAGFKPLFNLKPNGYEWNMVYMSLSLNRPNTQISPKLFVRPFEEKDIPIIVKAFEKIGWQKPETTFELYLMEQELGQRLMWVAFWDNEFAGYNTLKWVSDYPSFQKDRIPEIKDLNVLPAFRGRGIASSLMDIAEAEAAKRTKVIGLGVGLYEDYGAAQRLYIQKGYIPDGRGVTYEEKTVIPGNAVPIDDCFCLWLTKVLI